MCKIKVPASVVVFQRNEDVFALVWIHCVLSSAPAHNSEPDSVILRVPLIIVRGSRHEACTK